MAGCPEHAKKSNIIAFGLRHCAIRNCINDTGFGKPNTRLPKIWVISRLPFRVYPTVSGKTVDNPVYLLDISLKNFFLWGVHFFYSETKFFLLQFFEPLFLLKNATRYLECTDTQFLLQDQLNHNEGLDAVLRWPIPKCCYSSIFREGHHFAECNRSAMQDNHLEWKYPSSVETYVSSYIKSLFLVL